MNEMMAMPFMVLVILGTAVLSAVITTALPSLPNYWNALKNSIRRKTTPKSDATDIVDVILIAKLTKRIDDLKEQLYILSQNHKEREEMVDNIAEQLATRDKNRRNNIRRDVRDYLKELQK